MKNTGIKIDYCTVIGNNSIVKSLRIGKCVRIGSNCVLVSSLHNSRAKTQ